MVLPLIFMSLTQMYIYISITNYYSGLLFSTANYQKNLFVFLLIVVSPLSSNKLVTCLYLDLIHYHLLYSDFQTL